MKSLVDVIQEIAAQMVNDDQPMTPIAPEHMSDEVEGILKEHNILQSRFEEQEVPVFVLSSHQEAAIPVMLEVITKSGAFDSWLEHVTEIDEQFCDSDGDEMVQALMTAWLTNAASLILTAFTVANIMQQSEQARSNGEDYTDN